jgi:hypothetical protein
VTSAPRRRIVVAVLALAGIAAGCTNARDPAAHAAPSASKPAARPAVSIDAGAADASTAAIADAATAEGAGSPGSVRTSYTAALRSADWARWPGLPAGAREADLVRDLGLGKIKATRRTGRLGRHDVIIVERPGLRYWLRDSNRVVLVEVTGQLGSASPAALRAELGAPDREGAGRFLQSGATTTEYVYASRGIALTVAESYDNPPKFAPRLAAVRLFAPGDLRAFDLELGGKDRAGPSR